MKKQLPIARLLLVWSVSVGAFLLFFVLQHVFAQTSGVTFLNKRNVIFVYPTPIPGHQKTSQHLTRNTSFHKNSNTRRINDKNHSFAEKNKGFATSPYAPAGRSKGHSDPLHAKISQRAKNKNTYSKKLIQNTAGFLSETAPSQGTAAFAPSGQGK
ncbi:MAG: hypothetical protein ACREL1_00840 [bacterium]